MHSRFSAVFLCLSLLLLLGVSKSAPWYKRTNIYELYVHSFGGNLNEVTRRLPYLAYVGIKTVWLMPIFDSSSDHGYDTKNYFRINPKYGSEKDLANLVSTAAKYDIKIVLDLVMNHCGRDNPLFSSRDSSVRRDNWFCWSSFDPHWGSAWPSSDYYPTWHRDNLGISRSSSDMKYYYGAFSDNMPDFNYLTEPGKTQVIDYFKSVIDYWVTQTNVAGFRCDAARYIVETGKDQQRDRPETHQVWKTYKNHLRTKHAGKNLFLLAEAPTESDDELIQYYGKNGDEFDSCFHFRYNFEMLATIKNERRVNTILEHLHSIQKRLMNDTVDTIFLSNHDSFTGDRVATQMGGYTPKIKMAASLYLLFSGVPVIYYGEEIAMKGCCSDEGIRGSFDFNEADRQMRDKDSVLNHYKRLLSLRNLYDALAEGYTLYVPHESDVDGWDNYQSTTRTLAFLRVAANGEKALIVHNFASNNAKIHVSFNDYLDQDLSRYGSVKTATLMSEYSPVTESINQGNKGYFYIGELYGFTTKIIYLSQNMDKYKNSQNQYLTYNNALDWKK